MAPKKTESTVSNAPIPGSMPMHVLKLFIYQTLTQHNYCSCSADVFAPWGGRHGFSSIGQTMPSMYLATLVHIFSPKNHLVAWIPVKTSHGQQESNIQGASFSSGNYIRVLVWVGNTGRGTWTGAGARDTHYSSSKYCWNMSKLSCTGCCKILLSKRRCWIWF